MVRTRGEALSLQGHGVTGDGDTTNEPTPSTSGLNLAPSSGCASPKKRGPGRPPKRHPCREDTVVEDMSDNDSDFIPPGNQGDSDLSSKSSEVGSMYIVNKRKRAKCKHGRASYKRQFRDHSSDSDSDSAGRKYQRKHTPTRQRKKRKHSGKKSGKHYM